MRTYEDLITQFIYSELPALPVSPEIKLDAVAAEVFGTKQRRQGPLPSVEHQYEIRRILAEPGDTITFLVPWAASKQENDAPLDIAELMALRQLQCLRDGLARFGKKAKFILRVENLTDQILFGVKRGTPCPREDQIDDYVNNLSSLSLFILGDSVKLRLESAFTTLGSYWDQVEEYLPIFYGYLRNTKTVNALRAIGWAGEIPAQQRKYYIDTYQELYPGRDHSYKLACYFATTLARVRLGATAAPDNPHLQISFAHPVPGSPVANRRVYYRTIPERYTNAHRAPWMAQGYFRIDEDGECCPRIQKRGEQLELQGNVIDVGGAKVRAEYVLV